MQLHNHPGDLNMMTPNRIALSRLPALLAAAFLAQTGVALAAAPAEDAHTQARQLLAAPGGHAPGGRDLRVPARAGDAALSARGLLLGSAGQEHLPLRRQTLQARVSPEGAPHPGRAGRQDAQAQARRLIHGGVA
jgi:hypothetical protein